MFINDFERIALVLSNTMWCRHWKHWNYPQTPRIFALQAYDFVDGVMKSQKIPDLLTKGFREYSSDDGHIIYLIHEKLTEQQFPFK